VIHVLLHLLIVLKCFTDETTRIGMAPFLCEIPRFRTVRSNGDATEREIRKPLISQALQQVSSSQSEENEAGQGLERTLGTSGVGEFVHLKKTCRPFDQQASIKPGRGPN